MSIDDGEEWFYPENGSNSARLNTQVFLSGAGWDDPDDPFQKMLNDDEIEVRERITASSSGATRECTCQPSAMIEAGVQLIEGFEISKFPYPTTLMSIESFAGLGGPRNGPWSYWVNTQMSIEADGESASIIKLWGCHRPGHHCSIHRTEFGRFELRELELDQSQVVRKFDHSHDVPEADEELDPDEQDEVAADESDLEEEESYRKRTFGDLDETPEALDEEIEDLNAVTVWRETVFSEQDIVLYTNADLDEDDVLYLGRYMPWPEVSSWVERFKDESLMALELLRLGLGERSYNDEIKELDNDTLPGNVAQVIQMAIHGHLRKMRSDQKVAKLIVLEEDKD